MLLILLSVFLAVVIHSTTAWVHPGILHNTADLNRMQSLVAAKTDPWYTAYNSFAADSHSSATYALEGPLEYVCRDKDDSLIYGMQQFADDSDAALQTALMWTITGEESYAEMSVKILDGWGSMLKVVNGTDGQLAAALSGSQLVNAAEIIRSTYNAASYTGGWTNDSMATFSSMVTDVLVPPASLTNSTPAVANPFQANWGSSGEKFMLAAAVFTENATLYDYAKLLMNSSSCASFTGSVIASGQSSESGRDQQHTQLGLGNWFEAFTTIKNQYDPTHWFALHSNRLAAGFEYTAQYLMNGTVSYDPSFYRCDANLLGGPWSQISSSGLWPIRPVFEGPYAHYVGVMGVEMPYTKALIESVGIDGQNPSTAISDNAAWDTLRFRTQAYKL